MEPEIIPIHCILPPHMLQEIARRGKDRHRAWAQQTMKITEEFRGWREAPKAVRHGPSATKKRRAIYDARNGVKLPGVPVRKEGDPPTRDPAVNEAYDVAGATYDLFREVFQRNSIDGRGMRLNSTVHYGKRYDNAFWNGHQMVYGDGDGELFRRFTKAIDVIAHELTHGVTRHEAKLLHRGESGALNESFSDVFGSLVKQRVLGQTADEADWLMGQGLFKPKVRGVAVRSMKAPGTAYDDPVIGKDLQPAHMKHYKDIKTDKGGVHINSGIPNHAFYLVAMELGGYAWETAGRIWYIALRDRLGRRSTFRDAANSTFQVAADLFGAKSREQKAVRKAWRAVGLTPK